jgi:formylglycine-generating enzyme required for sulfatase activity
MFSSCKSEDIVEADIQVITQDFSRIGQNTAIGSGYITIDRGIAVDKRGICWSVAPNPTVEDEVAEAVETSDLGAFTAQLYRLDAATTYYARAYILSGDRVYYGNELSFVTKNTPTDGWCVVDRVYEITPTTAKVVMQIADDGNNEILEYGICYGLMIDPTIGDGKVVSEPGGFGFTADIFDLLQDNQYYVRPYFTTNSGTTYGESVRFTTLNFIKSIKVSQGYQAAYLFGQVIMDAGSPTTERGFCWGTTDEPTVEQDYFVTAGKGTGAYEVLVGGLTKGSTYYMRAYAKNDAGLFYGVAVPFTTKTGDIMPGANLSDMVLVEKGTFAMGEPNTATIVSPIDNVTYGKEPVHTVTISRDFFMDKYQITNEQLCTFLNVYQSTTRRDLNQALYNSSGRTFAFNVSGAAPNLNYTPVSGCGRKPASNMTWGCAYNYCLWLSAELGVTVRLPSEAEWEYAARGGNMSMGYTYSGSNVKTDVAVYGRATALGPNVVGSLAPNELGIYDMSGNAFDYCMDFFDVDYYLGQVGVETRDPIKTGPANGGKAMRGGSWRHTDVYLRVSVRGKCNNEADCGTHSGMRIVLEKLPAGI